MWYNYESNLRMRRGRRRTFSTSLVEKNRKEEKY
jgi:hypothetical protein